MRSPTDLPGRPPPEIRLLDRSARRARAAGQPRTAINRWLRALRRSGEAIPEREKPWIPFLLWEVARVFHELGVLGKARYFYRQALASLPETGSYRILRGLLRIELAELQDLSGQPLVARSLADLAFRDLAATAPTGSHRLGLRRLAQFFTKMGDLQRAELCREHAAAANPADHR